MAGASLVRGEGDGDHVGRSGDCRRLDQIGPAAQSSRPLACLQILTNSLQNSRSRRAPPKSVSCHGARARIIGYIPVGDRTLYGSRRLLQTCTPSLVGETPLNQHSPARRVVLNCEVAALQGDCAGARGQ